MDFVLASKGQNLTLVEVRGFADVGWNDAVAQTETVDLDRKLNGDAPAIEIARKRDDLRSSEALTIQNNVGAPLFSRFQLTVSVRIQGLENVLQRRSPIAIGEAFGMDARRFAELQRQLADTAIGIVPMFESTQHSDDKRVVRIHRFRWRNLTKALR